MTKRIRTALGVGLLLVSTLAYARRDPLNNAEVDQLRDTAQEPVNRLKLYAKFARARMVAINELRSDARFSEDRGQRIHDLLEDLTRIVDELDTNVDTYAEPKNDIRKALKEIIEADTFMQLKLRELKEGGNPKEAPDYKFALQDAIEAVNGSLDDARKTMDEQEALAKEKKLKKPE